MPGQSAALKPNGRICEMSPFDDVDFLASKGGNVGEDGNDMRIHVGTGGVDLVTAFGPGFTRERPFGPRGLLNCWRKNVSANESPP